MPLNNSTNLPGGTSNSYSSSVPTSSSFRSVDNYNNSNNNNCNRRRTESYAGFCSMKDVTIPNLTKVLHGRAIQRRPATPQSSIDKRPFVQQQQYHRVRLSSISGEGFIRLGEAAREGDFDAVSEIVENNGEKALTARFALDVTVRKDSKVGGEGEAKGTLSESGKKYEEEEVTTLYQRAKLELTTLHLAIIARQTKVVRVLIERATCFGTLRLRKILEAKTKMKFNGDPRSYQKPDQMLHEANAFHLAVLYHTASLRLLLRAVIHTDLRTRMELQDVLDLRCGVLVQSPLHTAAKSAKAKAIKMLLEAGADPNVTEVRGYTPLHLASKVGNTEVASMLMDYGADPDAKGLGIYEKTPLHRARKPGMVRILLDYGANPYETMAFNLGVVYDTVDTDYSKGDGEEGVPREMTFKRSALDVLMWRNPNAAAEILNQGLSSNNQDLDSSDLLIVLNMEVFHNQSQLARLKDETAAHSLMVEYGADNLLRHPLAEAFMHMKWNMVKRFFYINVTLYTAFVLSLTALAVTATSIVKDYTEEMHKVNMTPVEYDGLPMKECLDATEAGAKQNTFWTFLVLTLIGTVILTIREICQAYANWRSYFKSMENVLEVAIIILTLAYSLVLFSDMKSAAHLGSIAVFLTWIELTLLLGRFPTMGIYIYMSFHVMRLLLVILLVYLTTLLAFSFSFYLLLPTHDAFNHPISAFLKVLVMMIGEYDFESNFLWDQVQDRGSNGTVQALFIFFVFLITITISNLIVGLTVNKTEALFKEAGVIRLKKTVLQVLGTEDILMRSPSVIDYFPKKLKRLFYYNTQLFSYLHREAGHKSAFKVCVRPADVLRSSPHQDNGPGQGFSNAFLAGSGSGDELLMGLGRSSHLVPVYLYDEDKCSKGKKLRFRLPTWCIWKTLSYLSEKEIMSYDWEDSSDDEDDEDNLFDGGNNQMNNQVKMRRYTSRQQSHHQTATTDNNNVPLPAPSPNINLRRKKKHATSTNTLNNEELRNSRLTEVRKCSTDDDDDYVKIIDAYDEVDGGADCGLDTSEEMKRKMQELEGVSGEIQGQIRELKKLKRLSLVLAAEQMEGSLDEVKEEEEEEVMDERTKFFLSK